VTSICWRPSQEVVDRANITRLMRAHSIDSYDELVRRSSEEPAWFWDAVVADLDIEWLAPYERVFDDSQGPEWTTWFDGGRINVAHQCVDRWSALTPDAVAIRWEGEEGQVREWTYAQLRDRTDRVAGCLASMGVRDSDRVAILMPMAPETVAVLMACSKLGAIWVPLFSGFAAEAVAKRLDDSGASLLVTADGTMRKGSMVRLLDVAKEAVEISGRDVDILCWDRSDDAAEWNERLSAFGEPIDARPLPSEHPLFIAYTSGTTGRPKGVVHVHGGFLVKIAEEVAYQTDVHPGDVLHWATDLGWIMGPWMLVGSLALGATARMFEGAPNHPSPDRIWSLVEHHRITALGVSPTLIRALVAAGTDPGAHDLSSLRLFGSTGELWDPESYGWLMREAGGDRLPIINLTGGTEVGACFLSPLPITELKPCTVRGPALGMAVDILDEGGEPVDPGEVGELVCRKPWPSMARGIWGDRERFLETYWRRFPGIWVHGDWASRDADGFWYLHGRSDDTLNIAGKRLGPAEVESALTALPGLTEAAAVGVPDDVKGELIWCFVVVSSPQVVSESQMIAAVSDALGAAFAPKRVLVVPALPKTRNAKILRRAVRAAASDLDPGDLSSLENPEALAAIRAIVNALGG
jgi:acetyl-CoA synthetase